MAYYTKPTLGFILHDIEPITLVRILDKLEARGLIERRQHPTDRRVWQLFLAPEAHPLLTKMRDFGDLTRGEALAGIPDQEREHLLEMLTTMKKNLIDACEQPVERREASHG